MDATEITDLLQAWQLDFDAAWHDLVPRIYEEMRRLARYHRKRGGDSSNYQTTELLHETLMRMERQNRVTWNNRKHFFAVATTLMRRILLDQAREQGAAKRGAHAIHLPLESGDLNQPISNQSLIALDAALTDLARIDPPLAKLVELRVFGGLTIAETADVLDRSAASIKRDWETARMWLFNYLTTS